MQAQQRKQLIGASVVALGLVGVGAWLWSRPEPVPPPPPLPPIPHTPPAEMETVRAVIHETPLLSELRDSARPIGMYPVGSLLYTGREWREMSWHRGELGHVLGMTIEARRSHGDSAGFAFRDDLGPELQVTSTHAFCEGASAPAARGDTCDDRLERWMLNDVLVAWDACHIGDCGIFRERNGAIERQTLPNISNVRMQIEGTRTLALVSTHPTQEGGSQHVLAVFDVGADRWAPLFQELIERTMQEGEIVTNLTSEYTFAEDGMHITTTTVTQNVNRVEPLSEDRQDRLLPWPTPTGT